MEDDSVANPFVNPENDQDLAIFRSSPMLADARPPLSASKVKLRATSYPAPRNATSSSSSTSPGRPLAPSPLFERSSYHETPPCSPTEEDPVSDMDSEAELLHAPSTTIHPFSKLRSASVDCLSSLEDSEVRGMPHLPHLTLQRRSSVHDRQRMEVPIAKMRRTHSVDAPTPEAFGEDSNSCPAFPTSSSSLTTMSGSSATSTSSSEVFCVLPTIDTDERTKRITPQTLARLLAGEFTAHFDRIVIVDCRFDYEYDGGHVDKAININTKEALETLFYPPSTERVCVVFHCEFSSHRAPRTWGHMRSVDRTTKGMAHYPELFYPDIYVMDGGYKSFFQQYPELCSPKAYIEMKHPDFAESCGAQMTFNEREWGSTRTNVRSRTSMRDRDPSSP